MKLEAIDHRDLKSVIEAVDPICRRHSVARLQVFGSLAAGTTHPDSDVDFLVEFEPAASVGLLEMGGLKEDLEDALGCPVDLLSRAAVEHSRNPYRRRNIFKSPITIYGE